MFNCIIFILEILFKKILLRKLNYLYKVCWTSHNFWSLNNFKVCVYRSYSTKRGRHSTGSFITIMLHELQLGFCDRLAWHWVRFLAKDPNLWLLRIYATLIHNFLFIFGILLKQPKENNSIIYCLPTSFKTCLQRENQPSMVDRWSIKFYGIAGLKNIAPKANCITLKVQT